MLSTKKTILILRPHGKWEVFCRTTAPTPELLYEDMKCLFEEYPISLKFENEEEIFTKERK